MKVVLCTDDRGGLLFAGRRQSADQVVLENMAKETNKSQSTLWVSAYSKELFTKIDAPIQVLDEKSVFAEEDIVFIEDIDPQPFIDKAHTVLLYNWGKTYPATTFLQADLQAFRQVKEEAFVGDPHEEMLVQVWTRNEETKEE